MLPQLGNKHVGLAPLLHNTSAKNNMAGNNLDRSGHDEEILAYQRRVRRTRASARLQCACSHESFAACTQSAELILGCELHLTTARAIL